MSPVAILHDGANVVAGQPLRLGPARELTVVQTGQPAIPSNPDVAAMVLMMTRTSSVARPSFAVIQCEFGSVENVNPVRRAEQHSPSRVWWIDLNGRALSLGVPAE